MSVNIPYGSIASEGAVSLNSSKSVNIQIFAKLFETVEKHVIEHIPLEVTAKILEVRDNYYHPHNFQGVSSCWQPSNMDYNIVCSCGLHWSISCRAMVESYANVDGESLVSSFCRGINERYASNIDSSYYDARKNGVMFDLPPLPVEEKKVPVIDFNSPFVRYELW